MPEKYLVQRRTADGLETVAELPMLDGGKIDISSLPVVGAIGAAIIAEGTNTNGYWIRLANGLRLCFKKNHVATPVGDVHTWTFPLAFLQVPAIFSMGQFHGGETWLPCIIGYSPVQQVYVDRLEYEIRNPQTGASFSKNGRFFDFLAIGY